MIPEAAYTVVFYSVAAAAVVMALAVACVRRLLWAAVYLMGVLLASAALYVMLGAEFLAGIQVLVYVGGIVVLIVFAVMLTNSAALQEDRPTIVRRALGVLVAGGFLVVTGTIFGTLPLTQSSAKPIQDNTASIGQKLLDAGPGGYVLPFEIISLLLLAAIIGGVVVARKSPPDDQPFTTGGDQPGEAEARLPNTQRERKSELGTRKSEVPASAEIGGGK